jgi:hypothetical protein
MRTRRPFCLSLIALPILAAGFAAVLTAQDIDPNELFKTAKSALDEKKYGKALAELNLLVGEISKLRAEQLKQVLPAAPAGWTAEDATGEASPIAGVGITVKRHYQAGEEKTVDLEMLCDSPMVGMLAPMLSNPALLRGQEGTSVVTLKGGRRAILEYHKDSKSGNLKILLNANTTLLTLTGNQVERADLLDAFGKAVDLDAIEKALQS